MAKTITLANLRTLARRYADLENDTQFATDAEVTDHCNRSYAALYDILTEADESYHLSSDDQTTAAGTNNYALPADFYKLRGVDLSDGGTNFFSMERFNFAERNTRRNGDAGHCDTRYALWGSNVRLIPAPPSGRTLRIWYVPAYTSASADGDTFDGVNGWEEWVAIDVAIKLLQKEESDTTDLERRQAGVLDRILGMAKARDTGAPKTIVDVDGVYETEGLLRRRP